LTTIDFFTRVSRWVAGLSLFCSLLSSLAFAAQPKIFIQSSKHIEVLYYSPAYEYLVTHLIRSYENALNFESNLFHYTPSKKLSVSLEDFEDYGHGGAGTVPSNFIDIGIEPFSYVYETLPANERMTWIMNHESTHIVMGDNANSTDRRFRSLFFGKVAPTDQDPISIFYSSVTSPRYYSTRWFHEGIATFMETWMAGGLGRAIGGWDEMVFRGMVRDDAYIYDVVGLEAEGTSADFQTGANSYLYGTRFMTWVAYTYGPGKLLEWITRGENTKRYFGSRFKQVYGIGMDQAWKMWIADERKFQEANLAEIRKYPVTVPQRLTTQTLGSVSRAYFDPKDNVIYAGIRYPAHLGNIAAIHVDTGKVDELRDIKGPGGYYVTSLAWDPRGRKLYYTTDNNGLRDLNVYDVETHHSRELQKDIRTGDLAFDAADGSIWGVRHSNGLCSLVEIPAPYKDGDIRREFDYGTDVFDIDVSPDGQFLTGAISDVSGKQKLVRFRIEDLRKGQTKDEITFETLYEFEYNSPGNFVYSPDGRYLYGSSYYTGASNLFRYNFETKKMDVISNAETGLFRPLPLADGSLIAFEYTSKGFMPARVPTKALDDVSAVNYFGQATVNKYPELKAWKLPPPSSVNSENLITQAGLYKPLQNVHLISAYPIVQGYRDTVAVGMRAEFADRLSVAGINVDAGYSPDPSLPSNQRAHVSFEAHWWDWKLTGSYNYADFYDLFGPTKVSRKGESLKLAHSQNLIYDTPRTLTLNWSVAGYSDLNALPEYQNISTNNIGNLLDANLGLKYSNLVKAQAAVDDENGTQWGLHSRLYYTHGAFPSAWGNYDRGFLLPRNSAFWLRSSAGKSYGNINSPFASYYFGAFGNNYIDHLSIDRFRDFYSFPGVAIDAISARSFGKLLGEYNLPPMRFREFGTTWLYVNWARFTLFSSDLVTNFTSIPSRANYVNLGTQLDVRLVLFSFLSSTFSSGYAAAEHDGHITTEYMFSLKIL
jgi:DNA-binding beta-propeller fold protein YncE